MARGSPRREETAREGDRWGAGGLLATPVKRNYIGAGAAPFVYRLGRQIFNLKRGVRLP